MKKVLMLPLLAMVALVSQAWADVCKSSGGGTFCQFDNGCYEMSSDYSDGTGCKAPNCSCDKVISNCVSYGSVYKGVTGLNADNEYGKGVKCKDNGGTWTNEGKNPDRTALGCCKWETESECYTIWSGKDDDGKDGTDQVNDCKGGSNKFWSGQCPSSGCPSGKPDYDGENPADGFCCWVGNEYNDYTGSCVPIGGKTTTSECEADYGEIVSSCGSCQTSPILKFTPASTALIVAPYGRSLHIYSVKDAMVSLYDMSGAKVYSGRVRAGNSVFGLERVASGSYYAIVQSGSNAKKVPVILK